MAMNRIQLTSTHVVPGFFVMQKYPSLIEESSNL